MGPVRQGLQVQENAATSAAELLELNREVQGSRAVRLLATQNLAVYATLMERHLAEGMIAETDLVVRLERDLTSFDETGEQLGQSGLTLIKSWASQGWLHRVTEHRSGVERNVCYLTQDARRALDLVRGMRRGDSIATGGSINGIATRLRQIATRATGDADRIRAGIEAEIAELHRELDQLEAGLRPEPDLTDMYDEARAIALQMERLITDIGLYGTMIEQATGEKGQNQGGRGGAEQGQQPGGTHLNKHRQGHGHPPEIELFKTPSTQAFPQQTGRVGQVLEIGKKPAAALCFYGRPGIYFFIVHQGFAGIGDGVVVAQQSLLNLITWHQRERGVTERDRGTQLAGLGFDATVIELWPYLAAGAAICMPDFELPAPARQLRDWLIGQAVTVAFLPTPMTEELLAEEWPPGIALRMIFTAGDRLKCRPRAGLPFTLINDYGPAENTVAATWAVVEPSGRGYPPIGRPVCNVQTYVLDRCLRPLPVGVPGELHLGGAGLAQGYLNRPELTRSRFIGNPFAAEPSARMYKTGDRVRYLPDGQLEFLGRVDNQVKVRGVRVELPEIEAAIEEAAAAVQQAVVLLREAPGGPRLIAWLTTDGSAPADAVIGELREKLPRRLPRQLLPSSYMALDAFPLTPNGKIDRQALPDPGRARPALRQPLVAARSPGEAALLDLWKAALQLDEIGVEDDFFELGGDSLQMVRILSRLRAEGLPCTPSEFLAGPTIGALAERLAYAPVPSQIGRAHV